MLIRHVLYVVNIVLRCLPVHGITYCFLLFMVDREDFELSLKAASVVVIVIRFFCFNKNQGVVNMILKSHYA